MTPTPLTLEQLQRKQIRDLQAEVAIIRNVARKWENDAMHLKSELQFITTQNDNLVMKLQTARRQLDYCERMFGFKIPTAPEPEQEIPHQSPPHEH